MNANTLVQKIKITYFYKTQCYLTTYVRCYLNIYQLMPENNCKCMFVKIEKRKCLNSQKVQFLFLLKKNVNINVQRFEFFQEQRNVFSLFYFKMKIFSIAFNCKLQGVYLLKISSK